MKLGRPHSKVAPAPGENLPARRLNEPPVLLALVAMVVGAVWLGMLLAPGRRSRTWVGDVSPPVLWRVLAVGGLSLSAALNIGLAPAYFEEANVYGFFFSGAGIALAAAAVWAWPSLPAYLAGTALPLALILFWTVFQLVPPPGAGTAEPLDLMGLFTNATELLACAALWLRAPRRRRKRAGADGPVDPGRA